ncbi:HYR domain-containing protein [Archangium gephyra]|uniref:HYR domain-containing protein n=1 Tax=Archangium gephyra TaxID=48 RepID=UPI003B7C1338
MKDILPGPTGGVAAQAMLTLKPEGLVVFAASDGVSGLEPWVSDGTEAGTRPLGDLSPGPYSSNPRLFTRVGDSVFFVATDGTSGFELWRMMLDTTPPTVTCPSSRTVEALGGSGARVDYPPAEATDDSPGAPSLTYSQASGTVFPLGKTAVTVTAKDAAENTASCSFDVIVQDTLAPALSCPEAVTAEATGATGATVTYASATASDAVTPSPGLTYSQASETVFPLGATDVTVTARDGAGNATACHFTVTVRDTTPPLVGCAPDLTVEGEGPEGASVSYLLASPLDAVTRSPVVSASHAPGSRFPLGETPVTVTARDEADNASSCTFLVTVRDTTPPSLACPAEVTAETPDAQGAVISYAPAVASDAVTASPLVAYSQASGSLFPPGTTSVKVTARDEAGLVSECSFRVTVRQAVPEPPPVDPVEPVDPVGCACASGSGGAGSGAWLLLLGSAAWLRRRARNALPGGGPLCSSMGR